jgi:hypothetical protein
MRADFAFQTAGKPVEEAALSDRQPSVQIDQTPDFFGSGLSRDINWRHYVARNVDSFLWSLYGQLGRPRVRGKAPVQGGLVLTQILIERARSPSQP